MLSEFSQQYGLYVGSRIICIILQNSYSEGKYDWDQNMAIKRDVELYFYGKIINEHQLNFNCSY